jgi:hypothetical protein
MKKGGAAALFLCIASRVPDFEAFEDSCNASRVAILYRSTT